MRLTSAVALVSIAATTILAGISGEPDAPSLGINTFSEFTNAGKMTVVEFTKPCGSCPYCTSESKYKNLGSRLKEIDIPFARVDCEVEADLCKEQRIFSSELKIFRNSRVNWSPYFIRSRNTDDVINYVEGLIRPALSELTADKLAEFTALNQVVIVGSFPKDSEKGVILEKIATEQKEYSDSRFGSMGYDDPFKYDMAFGVVDENPDVEGSGVVLYKGFDERKNILEGDFDRGSLIKFIRANNLPIMGELGQTLEERLWMRHLPLAHYLYSSEEDRQAYGPQIEALAKELKGKMNFVYVNVTKYGYHTTLLDLGDSFPSFGIRNLSARLNYPLVAEINMSNIKELANSVLDGTAVGLFESAPIPEFNDGPVKVVVGYTYKEIVEEESRDVVIHFYQSCYSGTCPYMAPSFDDLGALYEGSDIVIAKYDIIPNGYPVPFRFSIPPLVKLRKAGSNEYVDYKGDFTKKDLVKFISENAVNKFDVQVEDEGEIEEELLVPNNKQEVMN